MGGSGPFDDLTRRLLKVADVTYNKLWRIVYVRQCMIIVKRVEAMKKEWEAGVFNVLSLTGLCLKDEGICEVAAWCEENPEVCGSLTTIDFSRNFPTLKGLKAISQCLLTSCINVKCVNAGGGDWFKGKPRGSWTTGIGLIGSSLRAKGENCCLEVRCRGDYEAFGLACAFRAIPTGPTLNVFVDCFPAVTSRGCAALQSLCLIELGVNCCLNAPGHVSKGLVRIPPTPEGNGCAANTIEVGKTTTAAETRTVVDFISTSNATRVIFRISQPENTAALLAAMLNPYVTRITAPTQDILLALEADPTIGQKCFLKRIDASSYHKEIVTGFPGICQLTVGKAEEDHGLGLPVEVIPEDILKTSKLHTIAVHDGEWTSREVWEGIVFAKDAKLYYRPFAGDGVVERAADVFNRMDDDLEYDTPNAAARLAEVRTFLKACRKTNNILGTLPYGIAEPVYGAAMGKLPMASVMDFVVKVPISGPPARVSGQVWCGDLKSVGGWSSVGRLMGAGGESASTSGVTEEEEEEEEEEIEQKKIYYPSQSCPSIVYTKSSGGDSAHATLSVIHVSHKARTTESSSPAPDATEFAPYEATLKASYTRLRTKGVLPATHPAALWVRSLTVRHRRHKTTGGLSYHFTFKVKNQLKKQELGELAKQFKRDLSRDDRKVITVRVVGSKG
eukprot:TRINITY_DN1023_c0_g1_i3.p1 TRINITY_DN1023_c0_g1~~TRINITY_DN1023_c0_g1_i3.p1  ORF type:complete len:674 (+),score=125.72 TRINITY_DN1023_c0_g1_i3:38-2059(+)